MQAPRAKEPGRLCPTHYGYAPGTLSTPAALEADTLYVAGGLYGNIEALDALEASAKRDENDGQHVAIVFNGDFHWFDAETGWFHEVNERVFEWTPAIGSVETALLDRFVHVWPENSAARAAYFHRLTAGPDFRLKEALRDYRDRRSAL